MNVYNKTYYKISVNLIYFTSIETPYLLKSALSVHRKLND